MEVSPSFFLELLQKQANSQHQKPTHVFAPHLPPPFSWGSSKLPSNTLPIDRC